MQTTIDREDIGMTLHDRATRGEILAPAEIEQLAVWYATQDKLEAEVVDLTVLPGLSDDLQSQVDAALGQLTVLSRRIQRIAGENDVLRRDIADLRRRIAQKTVQQPV